MFQAKKGVLDRIEQSFTIFFKKPLQIILPMLIFHAVMLIVVPEIWKLLFSWILMEQKSISGMITFLVSTAILYALVYLICILPITYATIKTICKTIRWENINTETNIKEGFSYIGKIFRVYWFIFAYAYLMPALCFIAGGFILLWGMLWDIEIVRNIWIILMWFSTIYALVQGVYRWIKTSFALPSAIYQQNYEKNNFHLSVSITDGKWWRILWNYLLVGIIWWLMVGLISGLTSSLSMLWTSYTDIIASFSQDTESINLENIQNMLKDMTWFNIFTFIANILNTILDTLLAVFVMIFSVVFYLRLRDEHNSEETPDSYSKETLPVLEEL